MSRAADIPADIDAILDLAGRLADAVRPITLKHFRSGIGHVAKATRAL